MNLQVVKARENKGFTRRTAAALMGESEYYLLMVEQGAMPLTDSMKNKMQRAYDCKLKEGR